MKRNSLLLPNKLHNFRLLNISEGCKFITTIQITWTSSNVNFRRKFISFCKFP
ncbi:MAG: hypothetical protein ACTS6G_00035 [Candidatus Hodgkinia cicadicola]